jgi:hypothetical protein
VLHKASRLLSNPFAVDRGGAGSGPRVRCATLGCVIQPLRRKGTRNGSGGRGIAHGDLVRQACEEAARAMPGEAT